jgi:hypothetical protein
MSVFSLFCPQGLDGVWPSWCLSSTCAGEGLQTVTVCRLCRILCTHQMAHPSSLASASRGAPFIGPGPPTGDCIGLKIFDIS